MKRGTTIRRGIKFARTAQPILPGDAEVIAPVKTFEEIAAEMRITRSGAHILYRRAMEKLRANPAAIALLEDAVAFEQRKEVCGVREVGAVPRRFRERRLVRLCGQAISVSDILVSEEQSA